MKTTRNWFAAISALALMTLLSAGASPTKMHLHLLKAEPAADSTIAQPPSVIRLQYSEAPQAAASRIKVLNQTSGSEVAVGAAKADATDARILVAPVTGNMTAGKYSVVWRAMSNDGHVVRDSFHFVLKSDR
jgi:methionine-rich copper-binding protein CopC